MTKHRLGELLIQQELATREVIEQALRAQVGGSRRLGHILVRMKVISEDQLAEILAEQLNISLCNIGERFSPEAGKILPRYLCRKYSVLPLKVKQHNIVELAMANPADEEAIADIEKYTGMVAEPYLARHSDIEREISRRVPWGSKDLFSPRSGMLAVSFGMAACLALVIFLGIFTYNYIQQSTYGTVSRTADATLYQNHDLMLGVDKKGTISLLGRGSFSDGYYSVSFTDPLVLRSFIEGKKADFSEKQKKWLEWAMIQVQSSQSGPSLAAGR